jgi:hypothetical protein
VNRPRAVRVAAFLVAVCALIVADAARSSATPHPLTGTAGPGDLEAAVTSARSSSPRMVPGLKDPDRAERLVRVVWWHAEAIGIDPRVALCQQWVETGKWGSWWFAAPRRNPAGIAVNGATSTTKPQTGPWQPSPKGWAKGRAYPDRTTATLDHLQALAFWAGIPDDLEALSAARARLTAAGVHVSQPPAKVRGSAPTTAELGAALNPTRAGWAHPGAHYGATLDRCIDTLTT